MLSDRSMSSKDGPDEMLSVADEAAARGDAQGALIALDQAIAVDDRRLDIWMRMASMRRALGDLVGSLAAVERALAIEPLDFIALLFRGHLLEQVGDAMAGEVYGYALAQAPEDRSALAAGVVRMLDHASDVHGKFRAQRERAIATAMTAAEQAADDASRSRMVRFRSNVLRKTRPYHSEPTDYHYPGLIEREFHERGDFPWIGGLEAATSAIREELLALLRDEEGESVPYVQYDAHVPMAQWAGLNQSLDWTALHLIARGRRVEANAGRCPATMAALELVPQPNVPGYGPNAMFSLLKPGAHIPPHVGVANTRLVCHLPLVVPPGCWFRVGAERREWIEGAAFVFDDTIEHEAANESAAPRIVLIVDVWHPGLNAVERDGVSALMTSGGRTGRLGSGAL